MITSTTTSFGRGSSIKLALCCAVVALCGVAQADVQWRTDYSQALAAAKASRKPILVDFFAEWCGPCKQMEHDAFGNPTIQGLLKRVICCRLDVDKQPPLAKRFSVNGIPRVILLSEDGSKVKMDQTGYADAPTFAAQLSDALGVKVGAVATSNDPPQLIKVREALSNGSFGKLNPADAKAGMALLVAQLGVFDESQFDGVAGLISKAGNAAIPYLVDGMGHKNLAVRVGSYKELQTLLGASRRPPGFDPWAKASVRAGQLAAVRRWLGGAHPTHRSG